MEHPFNHSHSEDGMGPSERWIGVTKNTNANKGSKSGTDLLMTSKFVDIRTMGAHYYDQIEPSKLSNSSCRSGKYKLSWDVTGTDTFKSKLINAMPEKCHYILNKILKIEFGQN